VKSVGSSIKVGDTLKVSPTRGSEQAILSKYLLL